MRSITGFIVAILLIGAAEAALTCSTFVLHGGDRVVFGRNYDFFTGDGFLVANKRGVSKTALLAAPEVPAKWVSTYGSITFNQVGREFPMGGMNEAGLVVESMWLQRTSYEVHDRRPVVSELQWIQYQLDNFGNVTEVIDGLSEVRIGRSWAKLHFFICDRSGDAVIIEFVDQTCKVYWGDDLPVTALTNSTYEHSTAYLAQHEGFGGDQEIMASRGSLDRFVRIAVGLRDYTMQQSNPLVEYAYTVLASVASGGVGSATYWSIVYDPQHREIHYKTFGSEDLKYLDFDDFDFSCDSLVRVLHLDEDLAGDVSRHFTEYSAELNRSVVSRTFARYEEVGFMAAPTPANLEMLTTYPQSTTCQ